MTLAITVSGKVQGVGYRAFTEAAATEMGVVGAVWNMPNGCVGIFAQHPNPRTLDDFLDILLDGPSYADVDTLHHFQVPNLRCTRFEVLYLSQ